MSEFAPVGNLKTESIHEIWNSEELKKIRRDMLNGTPVNFCSNCHKEERVSGHSYRTRINEEFKEELHRIKETSSDGALQNKVLPYLDVRFSNRCNLTCRSCNAENSTSWFEEYSNLVPYAKDKVLELQSMSPKLMDEIFDLASHTKKLYFAGGEPLFDKNHYLLLEKLIADGKTDVLLGYNTNLSNLKFGTWNVIDLWKKFRFVHIGASIDGVGTQFEYLRKGAQWEQVKKNLLLIKSELKNSTIHIFPTVGATNCFHITQVIQEMIQLKILVAPENLEINYLHDPAFLNVSILNPDERQHLKSHYESFLTEIRSELSPELAAHIENELRGLLRYMDASDKTHLRPEYKKYSLKLDHFRKEKTIFQFPELFNLLYQT